MKPAVKLLITDLDNTLYDWVSFFAQSFHAMVVTAARILDVPKDVLLDQLQAVHRRHRNSEHPFALLETEVVNEKLAGFSRPQKAEFLDGAFYSFNSERKKHLKIYPTVIQTLEALRVRGTTVVGHTEATVVNAQFRLGKLGLTPFVARLYAAHHENEEHPNPIEKAGPAVQRVRHLRENERKPNPQIVVDICTDVGVSRDEAVYVGDSLQGDVAMAKAAGAWAAWAEYGTKYDQSDWDAVVRVSHWTEDDVQKSREARLLANSYEPDAVLARYSDLLDCFEFVPTLG